MKNYYYSSLSPPPVVAAFDLSQITQVASAGITWGSAVGLGVMGVIMALSIVAFLFKK